MAVWPQKPTIKKILAEFKSGGHAFSISNHHKYYTCNLSGSVAILSLEVLEQSREFLNLKKFNWQRASAEPATWTAHIEGHWTGSRALLHTNSWYVTWEVY